MRIRRKDGGVGRMGIAVLIAAVILFEGCAEGGETPVSPGTSAAFAKGGKGGGEGGGRIDAPGQNKMKRPATVTVTPDAGQSKVFGASDPTFTYTASPDVTLTGALARQTGENVGTYAYDLGDLSGGTDYTLVLAETPPSFEITPATVTVTPDAAQSKVVGESDPTFTYTASPDVTLTGALGRASGEEAGTYAFTLGSLSGGANYELVLGSSAPTFAITAAEDTCGDSVTFTYNGSEVTYGTVTGANDSCWLDRNLGASRAATSSTDAEAYGDLFQWGRAADGHQIRTSATTPIQSSTDTPGHGDFITTNNTSPIDWRSPQNNELWQGVSGANNPCPVGYRIPTNAEWTAEHQSWSSQDANGAFNSRLKLPVAGSRSGANGSLSGVGRWGFYRSSTVSGIYAGGLFYQSSALITDAERGTGTSVRCIKD